jgi:hypothetical protein
MVAQSILVGLREAGWGRNFERLLVQASVVEGPDETPRVQANKSNCSVGAALDKWRLMWLRGAAICYTWSPGVFQPRKAEGFI